MVVVVVVERVITAGVIHRGCGCRGGVEGGGGSGGVEGGACRGGVECSACRGGWCRGWRLQG